MNPYQKALKQKKFEGLKIEISPMSREDMQADAAKGDGAPDVLDDAEMETPDAEVQPEVAIEAEPVEGEMNPEELTSEDVFGAAAPQGRPKSLRERAMQGLKRKK